MKKNNLIFTCLFFVKVLTAQTLDLPISKANSQLFASSIFCFGLRTEVKKNTLCIYKIDSKLKLTDSLIIDLPKSSTDDYLQLYSDTLHNYLNIYLQKKDKKTVTIYRFDRKFKLIATIENADVARLNSISNFEKEVLHFENTVYTVKQTADTTGNQFYVNKYKLKSELKAFEYQNEWQFPFERRYINSAHLMFANKAFVFLYVNVLGGNKTGQWLLKINAQTGKLNKASKLNDKGEMNFYQYGNFLFDTTSQTSHLIGQRFTEAQFNQTKNTINITNATFASAYYLQIDSAGEQILKQDFKLPIVEPKTANKKPIANYLFRVTKFSIDNENNVLFETDIFKSTNANLCYTYCNTNLFKLSSNNGQYVLEKNSIQTNPLVETYLSSKDNLDMNGKLCADSLINFETVYYKSQLFPSKVNFKWDESKNPIYIVQKTDSKKGILDYSLIAPVNKIYKLQKIENINKTENPLIIGLSNTQYVIVRQLPADTYQLKIYTW
ncbi:MAG: hypothetical protein SFY56_12345 [Bacteroidota bacterium]|nr:hypothetical protein [Bacteroidota bacterium]